MYKRGILSALAIGIFAVAVTQLALAQGVSADSQDSRQMTIFLVDGAAVRHSDQGADRTKSLISLIATLQNDLPIMFISTEEPWLKLGPFVAEEPDFEKMRDELAAKLATPPPGQGWGVPEALAEAHTFMNRRRAGVGSKVYLVTGSSPEADFDGLSELLFGLVNRFGEMGWPINGVSLPGGSSEVMDFLAHVSETSGGQAFELTVSDGFRELADALLSQDARGSLAPVGQRVLSSNEVFTSVVPVAPGTGETTVLIFRESPYGSLRLSNPSGFEASAGDRTASSVIETPNMVIWTLIDPVPGDWRVDARGAEGLVSAWQYSSNKYNLVLRSASPLPLEKPAILTGYVEEGGQPIALEGVRLFANVTTPEGVMLALEMKDDGTQGDATAGDGHFSLILSPLRVQGEYGVELEASWSDHDHRISAPASFEARAYPAVEVLPVQLKDIEPGERTQVAKVLVHVQGEPYPVTVGQLAASLRSPGDEEGTLELVPQRLFGDGPASEYEVFFTAPAYGHYTQVFNLSLEYAGWPFNFTSDSFILSSVAPPALVQPVVEPVPVAPAAPAPAPQSQLVPLPPPLEPEASGFPWLVAFSVLMVGGVLAVAGYVATGTRPHGYIYDDGAEPLVDFGKLKRHPVLALLFRGSVRGKELRIPGFEGVVFSFSRGKIKLRSLGKQPTVRVNNHPLIGDATLEDRTWIGARGKLFTFMLSPAPAEGGAGAD